MVTSKARILRAVKANQPNFISFVDINIPQSAEDLPNKFALALGNVGGKFVELDHLQEVQSYINENFGQGGRVLSSLAELSKLEGLNVIDTNPHHLANVSLAVLSADIAVAENGACWLPERNILQRVLPFIAQHLIILVSVKAFVATMHQAYETIGQDAYGYGVFVAGPSKTADIEQSLVLGAHGPRSMTVCLINEWSA
ncbi:LutC/YkgG family protein [Pedobacter nanyangensis]|uniref:LutC/YkgG family protein n=1 Tax=Pedobacter nanyangensis TaxID=1562389 RepID=UPI000DE25BF1|nr:LUD domain-containing protein [Pedobacter nanyangensis]